MFTINKHIASGLYTILHFLVDGICSLVIFSTLCNNSNLSIYVFFIYNFLAFVTQPLVGLLIDKYKNERLFLLISSILLILGILLKSSTILSCVMLGIGNSFFHISGGKYVIEKTNNNIISLGIFVSTGALGLAIGRFYHQSFIWITFILLLGILTAILYLSKDNTNITSIEAKKDNIAILPILLICSVVFLRSFVGESLILDFNKSVIMLVMLSAGAMLGKAIGGIIAYFIGVNKTIILTMSLALILLLFFNKYFITSFIGIIFFNCSMPLTLYLINKVFKNNSGFSFGLLASILFPGVLLAMIGYSTIATYIFIATGAILSIIFVVISDKLLRKDYGSIKDTSN